MKQLIEWLIYIEDLASRIYEELAPAFRDDELLYSFLEELAADEAMHFHFMNSALICLSNNPDIRAEIILDKETTDKVEKPLKAIEAIIGSGRIQHSAVLKLVLESELSEWNDIFLYVINALKEACPRFKLIAPSIQNHLRHIEHFMEHIPNGSDLLDNIKKISPVWEEKILVVDDNEPILELLHSFLSREGVVEIAKNGEEALKMAANRYYAVIISDIDMPIMSGIDFYESLKKTHPNVGNRFIFISGSQDQGRLEYFKTEKASFMAKPFTFMDIRREVHNVIDRNTL